MYRKYLYLISAVLAVWGLAACQSRKPASESPSEAARPLPAIWKPNGTPAGWGDYWHRGKAEINTYDLTQNRYSDLHPGEVVLIFVTEDFLTGRQVKDESYQGEPSATVLKTNMLRRFTTGIYDYSIMTSAFTPVDVANYPHTLKVTNSTQDWCGQAFTQINLQDRNYRYRLHSYFEREADRDERVAVAALEDEIFNRIRINPGSLPAGDIRLLPSTTFCRLMHVPFTPQPVRASLSAYQGDQFSGDGLRSYRLEFPAYRRTLEIVFENAPPHRIAGWTDTYPSMRDGVERTTVARRRQTILDDYWRHNRREDAGLRRELHVEGR